MLGFHINTTDGFLSSLDYAASLGVSIFQIFLASPRKYTSPRKSLAVLQEFSQKLIEKDMRVVVHANYMLNFCNPLDSYKNTQAIKLLIQDLNESVIFGDQCLGVIIHMGSKLKMEYQEALHNYVNSIKHVLSVTPESTTIIFETGAGEGNEICTLIPDLAEMYGMFTEIEKQRLKFCIDTCHSFSAGYNFSEENSVEEFLEMVEIHLGWKNVVCIHLNNSKQGCGSKTDFHEDIDHGFIDTIGLKHLVKECAKMNIPMIFETPCKLATKSEQLNLVRGWIENCF